MPNKSLGKSSIGIPTYGMGAGQKGLTVHDRGTRGNAKAEVISHHNQVSDQKHNIFQAHQPSLQELHTHIAGVVCRCKRGIPQV